MIFSINITQGMDRNNFTRDAIGIEIFETELLVEN